MRSKAADIVRPKTALMRLMAALMRPKAADILRPKAALMCPKAALMLPKAADILRPKAAHMPEGCPEGCCARPRAAVCSVAQRALFCWALT